MQGRAYPTWKPVNRLIGKAKARLHVAEKRLRKLLKASNRALRPLTDPLEIDLGTHRWLSEDREEAYSDWLAWIMEQIDAPEEILRVVGQRAARGIAAWGSVKREVKREEFLRTDDGLEGRLDILIRFPGKALLVLEAKKGPAEGADVAKQDIYQQWLREQKPRRPGEQQFAVLVVTSAEQKTYHGFEAVYWQDVCLELRRVASRLAKERDRLIIAAMILAFVGAVEQNLLGFSIPRRHHGDVSEGERLLLVDPRVVEHLNRWVNKG